MSELAESGVTYRREALGKALSYVSAQTREFKPQQVIAIAKEFEEYITGKRVSNEKPELFE